MGGLLAVILSGCATIGTLGEDQTTNKVYSGTARDFELECFEGTCLDIPFSFIADTVLLPITVPWTLVRLSRVKSGDEPAPSSAQTPGS